MFGRAKGPIRNRVAYLRKAMPEFLADEGHEIYQFLVGRLVEHIDAARPNIDGMKSIVQQAAEAHDLPITDDSVECVIDLVTFPGSAEFWIQKELGSKTSARFAQQHQNFQEGHSLDQQAKSIQKQKDSRTTTTMIADGPEETELER